MRYRHALLGLATFCYGMAASAVEYVNDPLTASTFAGRGSKGGTFSANGWTTVDEPDAVWYEIPDALPTGKIQYTVTGISIAGALTGADHDILTMYQAPTGQAEPIPYMPYFRNNDFKVFTRLFGQQEPGRAGALKLEVAFCPRGDPWYHDEPCTAACDGSGLAYANGTDNDIGWDATTAYTMTLEWGNGQFQFARNGAVLGTVTYPGEYAPKPLRVRIGSPRHDGVYPGVAMMPKGITFKDVIISGTPGSMTAVCGAVTPPDAGPPPDSGTPDAGSSDYSVLADVTAASWETGVFPDANDLNIEADASGTPIAVVYLRFPAIPSGVVQKAVLRVHAGASGSAAGGSGVVCPVSDDTWSETTMTWATRPAVGTTCAGKATSVDPDTDVVWDVTPLVKVGGTVNLAIVSNDSNGAHFLSKEASATNAPTLSLEIGAGESDAGTAGTGGGGSGGWGTGGSGIDGGSLGGGGSGGGSSQGSTDATDGGCGCRTAGEQRSSILHCQRCSSRSALCDAAARRNIASMRLVCLGLVVALAAPVGCGDDSGGGPPKNTGSGGSSGSGNDGGGDEDEPIVGEPGVCAKLCCGSSDCASGEGCVAFETAAGSLGACMAGGANDSGAAGAAGSPGDAGLPSGCWTLNAAECNPLDNSGCEPTDACDYGPGDVDFEPIVACFGGAIDRGPGETCDGALGPWCKPGYHCIPK